MYEPPCRRGPLYREIDWIEARMTDANSRMLVTHPISAGLLAAALTLITLSPWQHRRA